MENIKKIYLKGYFTVEASLIIPFVIFMYLFLIFTAFFLYDRCLITQDYYIVSFRGSVFTYWGEGYGEVVYGDLKNRDLAEIKAYMIQRSGRLMENKYPAFQKEDEVIVIDHREVLAAIHGRTAIPIFGVLKSLIINTDIHIELRPQVIDPIEHIRQMRKEKR